MESPSRRAGKEEANTGRVSQPQAASARAEFGETFLSVSSAGGPRGAIARPWLFLSLVVRLLGALGAPPATRPGGTLPGTRWDTPGGSSGRPARWDIPGDQVGRSRRLLRPSDQV